ncbi:MAG: cytochrome P460 family protein [Gemmatimonadota bacterium]
MNFRRTPWLLLAVPFLLVAACAPAEEEEAAAEAEPAAETEAEVAQPDTTAEALWAHLEESDYQGNWSTWPGKGELYEGQEPHGMLLTTYLNPLALDALTNGAGSMPTGAIVVKENYMPDSTFAAATVMYKAAGYDPEHNDWFWMKRNADGTVEAQGRVGMCYGCHAGGADNDYLMTAPIK